MAQIKTYARLKPSKKPYSGYEINKNILTVHIPDLVVGSQQALRSNLSYDIMFTDIFRPGATQEDVFDGVAKGIIQSFLNGYNGTIFAYGQTGTGKTYTVEGNTTRYSTRGLSTRALSMIYQQLENRTDDHITVCLSYLEIYQEVAYDLLNPISRSSLPMAPFAKVTVVEGPRGSCIFRGLSLHLAANEEIAQMLLLQGQANRKVAETPVNQRSSRSHAVFTVYLQVRKHDSDVLLNSKLHLVDLAGSERVSKTGVDGQQLTEAKSINLSLHHLETVIIALQTERSISSSSSGGGGGEKNRGDYPASQSRSNTSFMSGPSSDNGTKPYKYVPYRNSLLTMVLKDSLGGNCLTAMIATISMEPENLGESISTCRFAQRVAHIANNARRNEEVDDKTVIKRLKHKVSNLEHQLAMLRSKGRNESIIANDELLNNLSEDDRSACAKIMDDFLQGVIADPVDAGIYDQRRFRECLHLLKHQYLNSVSSNCQFLASQQLQAQPRPAAVNQTSEEAEPLQPNNPHRDSGDHAMSEATQADSSVFVSQQRPVCNCPSEHSMNTNVEFLLANEDQVVGAVSSAETERKFADKIGSETEQLLEACAGKKPFSQPDRQRMKEFKKQCHKMTSLEQEQAVKQEQLTQMSQDILMQELLAAENSLRLKLQTVEDQVVQQHSYLMQLKLNQADVVQIAREQLVEQHLMKRQAKFHDKLIKLLENKAKLKCAISPDLTSLVSTRLSGEEKFVPLKQGKACQTCLLYEEKELSTKVDREKGVQKAKSMDIKESITPDKARELKQKFRLSQQQVDPMFGMNMEQYLNKSDQVQSSDSVDSNRSLRGNEGGSYKYSNSVLESSGTVNDEPKNDHSKLYPSKTSSTTGLQPKEKSLSEIYHATEPQAKHFQEFLTSGHKERLVEDTRLVKCSNVIKPNEVAKRLENGSSYSLRAVIPPYQDTPNNSILVRPGVATKNPAQESVDVLIESPTINGALPVEVRSFHDPHHSHKFALDDMPTECSSISSAKMGTVNNSDNKNNSYIRFVHCLQNQHLQCINYNTNAIADILEESETDQNNKKSAPECDLQDQCPLLPNSSMVSNSSVHTSASCNSVKALATKLQARTEFTSLTLNTAVPGIYSTKPNVACEIAETVAGHSNEELTESPNLCTILPSHEAHCTFPNQHVDTFQNALASGEHIKPLGIQNFPTPTVFPELPPYEPELRTKKQMDIIPSEMSSFKKCCSTSKSVSQQTGDHYQVFPQCSAPETSFQTELIGHSSDTEPVLNTTSACSPSAKNDYSAGGEKQVKQATSMFLSFGDSISGDSSEPRKRDAIIFQNEPDSVDVKQKKFRSDDQVDEEDRYEDRYDDKYHDDLLEANSFFGLHPPEVKLKAMTFEERERTYMLTVAAERIRVAKIRKARKAAEIIQGFWRAYKTEE